MSRENSAPSQKVILLFSGIPSRFATSGTTGDVFVGSVCFVCVWVAMADNVRANYASRPTITYK
jgi:hypothetical protein